MSSTEASLRLRRGLVVLAATLVVVLLPPHPAAASAGADFYRPPVDAPVIAGFDLPDGPYGRGNRGLDYATPPGVAVRAIGDGLVVFAGPVAGDRWVTVVHPDGLRSSYGPLARIDVDVGERVARGQPLGVAGELLHLGVRAGGTYLDPAALFGLDDVHLVPLDDPPLAQEAVAAEPLDPTGALPDSTWTWLTGSGAGEAAGTLVRRP